jgi:hypothetical protein
LRDASVTSRMMAALTICTFYEFVEPLWSQDEVTSIESAIKARYATRL